MKIYQTLLTLALLAIPFLAEASCQGRPSPTYVYYSVGGGVTSVNGEGDGAVSSTIGVRHKGCRLGWDFAAYAVQVPEKYMENVLIGFRGLGLFYLTPCRPNSLYAGAGLGVATRWFSRSFWPENETDITGLWGEFALGYEWTVCIARNARVKGSEGCCYQSVGYPMRLFVEMAAHQPIAVSSHGPYDLSRSPSLTLSLGVGF